MTVFFLIAATLGLLSVLGAAILIPYLCAIATGRMLSYVFQVEGDRPACDEGDPVALKRTAELDDQMVEPTRIARPLRRSGMA